MTRARIQTNAQCDERETCKEKHNADANGFTLVEIILGLLVLSLLLGGLFELYRTAMKHRRTVEMTALDYENAQLVKKALDISLGQTRSDLIEVTPDMVLVNSQMVLSLKSAPLTGKGQKSLVLSRFKAAGRRMVLEQSVELKSTNLIFEPKYDLQQRLRHVVVTSVQSNGKADTRPHSLAVSHVHVNGQRPCAFDSLTGMCRNLEP